MNRRLSGNHLAWLTTVAKEVREAGKPVSLDFLESVVPSQFATARNDGHVTAAENDLSRDDYRAGQRIWVEEAVAALAAAGLVTSNGAGVTWTGAQDGVWKVRFGRSSYTLYGAAESIAARDRHMLGHDVDQPGYLLKGYAEIEINVAVGVKDWITHGKHTLGVHPLAMAIPPMTPAEQESLRADIAKHGVRVPVILYPDPSDKTPRGKPKLKLLDGRNRGYFASVLGLPIRVEVFEGTEAEARSLVASLNLHRRHLTAAQKALAVRRLFGEQAKAEAKDAQIEGAKQSPKVRANLPEPVGHKSESDRWEYRAVKMAGGASAGVSPRSVRMMDEVAEAPETAAKVDSGEIKTVSEATRAAAIELGREPPKNVHGDTFVGELGRARGHLRKALELPVDRPTADLSDLVDELGGLVELVRLKAAERM
jgi:hypothetical protein